MLDIASFPVSPLQFLRRLQYEKRRESLDDLITRHRGTVTSGPRKAYFVSHIRFEILESEAGRDRVVKSCSVREETKKRR